MRTLAAPTFGPAQIASMEPVIARIARSYLDSALERGTFDFVTDLAAKVPMDVVSEVLGIPPADRETVRDLVLLAADRPPGSRDVPAEGTEALARLMEYLLDLIADRRRRPQEDLTSVLVASQVGGQPLTDAEIIPYLVLLIAAGYETITRLLAAAWYWAWRNPLQREIAFSGRIGAWVNETLRYDGPVQYELRTTTRAVKVAGTVQNGDRRPVRQIQSGVERGQPPGRRRLAQLLTRAIASTRLGHDEDELVVLACQHRAAFSDQQRAERIHHGLLRCAVPRLARSAASPPRTGHRVEVDLLLRRIGSVAHDDAQDLPLGAYGVGLVAVPGQLPLPFPDAVGVDLAEGDRPGISGAGSSPASACSLPSSWARDPEVRTSLTLSTRRQHAATHRCRRSVARRGSRWRSIPVQWELLLLVDVVCRASSHRRPSWRDALWVQQVARRMR
ncbi:cytochrome P450 [Actinomadura syzygii]|uniref:Cytochrome P450 n=1 Tax=Actinomadura syzygii TaxID=1427538 RepID=A0A5D0TSH2_9ACTN|nr:cytochrome P450 [Actinomadura syzygii]TYC08673.1 cytochrome P450 [Actinomadura syzygii]